MTHRLAIVCLSAALLAPLALCRPVAAQEPDRSPQGQPFAKIDVVTPAPPDGAFVRDADDFYALDRLIAKIEQETGLAALRKRLIELQQSLQARIPPGQQYNMQTRQWQPSPPPAGAAGGPASSNGPNPAPKP